MVDSSLNLLGYIECVAEEARNEGSFVAVEHLSFGDVSNPGTWYKPHHKRSLKPPPSTRIPHRDIYTVTS